MPPRFKSPSDNPFLDHDIDLTGTVFSQADLEHARAFLPAVLRRLAPDWLREPVGPLAVQWRAGGTGPVCFLIDFAYTLYVLNRAVTRRSEGILREKVTDLLRLSDEAQYDEALAELRVGRALAEWARPLALEPLVPEEFLGPGRPGARPRSPDFALRLPGGDLFAEATVLRVEAFEQWDASSDWLRAELARHLSRRRVFRSVQLELPLPFDHRALPRALPRDLAAAIADSEAGEAVHLVAGRRLVVRWRVLAGADLAAVYRGPLWLLRQGLQSFSRDMPAEDTREQLLRSLRGTLKRKRRQFRHEAPYALVLQLGHRRMDAGTIEAILREAIWPNGDYGWLTGVALFTPRRVFSAGSPPAELRMRFNPNARSAPTPAMRALFEGTQTFRYVAPGDSPRAHSNVG